MGTANAKYDLFVAWCKAGPTKVFFDSGFYGVEIEARFRDDPEMWVCVTEAKVSQLGIRCEINVPDLGKMPTFIPWGAVHTLESIEGKEVHVWGADLETATARKAGGIKEMKN